MERLTRKIRASVVFPNELLGVSLAPNNEYMHKLLTRLAAYEDTGLEPRDYAAMRAAMDQAEEAKQQLSDVVKILGCSNIDHLKELAQAEKDGRLVVLPCKVGCTVYRVITPRDAAPVVTEIEIKTLGQASDLIGRIGKKQLLVSWYLTREEAAAALKKREADNEAD